MDTRTAEKPRADRYLLQLWPAPEDTVEPARLIRQTSSYAAGCHQAWA